MEKEEFKLMEKEYNTWLYKHPKGDHNYKSFSHMRRSLEFAKYWNQKQSIISQRDIGVPLLKTKA